VNATRFSDAELNMLEDNLRSPIMQKLIEQIRGLQDDLFHKDIEIEDLRDALRMHDE
jgi:hypothetical protein